MLGLGDVQPALKARTMPKMREYALGIKRGAAARILPHPSGLWVNWSQLRYGDDPEISYRSEFSRSYYMTKRGDFWYQVHNGGGTAGRAKQIIEFARKGRTPQGHGLVRAIDRFYPRPSGGRVLWAEYDEQRDALVADFQAAVEQAAADIQKEVGGNG